MAKYTVDGFVFDSLETAKQAQKELEGVRYIRSQTRMNDPDVVMELYERLIAQDLFKTEVGISFLRELQEYLQTIPYVDKEHISPIPVKTQTVAVETEITPKRRQQYEPVEIDTYKKKFHVARFFCVVFFICLLGVFLITYFSGNNTNIFNYEQQIIDKYEAWEQELDTREQELDARESKLQQMMNATEVE